MSEHEQEREDELEAELEEAETPGLEPSEDDDDPDARSEAAPVESPPPSAVTPEQMEKRFAQAEKAVTTYVRRITDIYQEQALDLIECPLCPGIHKGFVNKYDAGQVPREVGDAVLLFLGLARERQYEQSARYRTCPACAGEGKVYTGSHVPTKETIRCDDCDGGGFIPPMRGASARNGSEDVAHFEVHGDELTSEPAERDAWGEPRILPDGRENPNYGKMPQFKVNVEPWGVTANLKAQDAV